MDLTLPFTGAHRSVDYVREKYNLKSYETSAELFEKEFNCKIKWSWGDCYIEFNDEKSFIWYQLKWSTYF